MVRHGTTRYEEDRKAPGRSVGGALEPLLTVGAVCEVLAVSKQTVYRLVHRGELKPTRVGERLRFVPEDVRDYLERHREAVASP
jgi:excisionase family DNA binding protein